MISGYMRLTREEAFAIRYHMGFSGNEDARNVGKAFEMFPIAFALSVADMEATYFIEGKIMNELFIKRMKELLKDDFDAFINSLNENEVKGFYLNPLKGCFKSFKSSIYRKHPYVDGGYYFDYLHYPLGKSPYFMCGLYYIQEPSAMSVAACLDIKENDYVLDMCGAPGGKTCYVASRLSNEGLMIANDISKLRASILSSNIERFGLKIQL